MIQRYIQICIEVILLISKNLEEDRKLLDLWLEGIIKSSFQFYL